MRTPKQDARSRGERFARWSGLVAIMSLVLSVEPPQAFACGTCEVGDRTTATMGNEPPYAGRLRVGVQLQTRSDRVGRHGQDEVRLREQRLNTFAAFAPTERWMLSLTVPVSRRRLRYVNLAEHTNVGLGDVDFRSRWVVYRDRRFDTRHLLMVAVGVELPTAQIRTDHLGGDLPLELQAGTASLDPLMDLAYRLSLYPLSLALSTSLIVPTRGRANARAGLTWLSNLQIQFEALPFLGVRAGFRSRVSRKTWESFGVDPNSGGAIVYSSLGLSIGVASNARLSAEVLVPTINALSGAHQEGMVITAGGNIDLR